MYKTILEQEIKEQPDVISRVLDTQNQMAATIAGEIKQRNIQTVVIAARGTSDNAGRYGQYLFGARNRLLVALATPSLYTLYGSPPSLKNTLVIGVSQSGQSPDILSVIEQGLNDNALTVAITNHPESPLGQKAAYCLDLSAGDEISLAATKTYTAQLTMFALLSTLLEGDEAATAVLSKIPGSVSQVIDESEETAYHIAERWLHTQQAVVIGRGFNYATAFEIALKLKELNYLAAEPYSSADFRHGPLAIVEKNYPAMILAIKGATYDEVSDLSAQLTEREADSIIITNDADAMTSDTNTGFLLPADLPEWLTPLISVIPGQMVALRLAEQRRLNPDQPRSLYKVTKTI